MIKPIVWTIAGSDSGGGAGIQADLHTFQALGAYGCSVITAITAQNSQHVHCVESVSPAMIMAQLNALSSDLPPAAIKLGMLHERATMETVASVLNDFACPVVIDPVMVATSGARLLEVSALTYLIEQLVPHATLLTPNRLETEILVDFALCSVDDVHRAAQKLLTMGAKSVLIKGGHDTSEYCSDYWTNGQQAFWLTVPRILHQHTHGSGCSLASALAACLALGYPISDALVIAKRYITQAIRCAMPYGKGSGPVAHSHRPTTAEDWPWITVSHEDKMIHAFPDCGSEPLGFYPIVDSVAWLEKLLPLGIKTAQLRIKHLQGSALENAIRESIQLAKQYNCRLFINDYWQLAIQHGAYGVHLGQEDLDTADCHAIARAGLRLGISTHSDWEIARAHAFKPSYIAIGPIYPTQSKPMAFAPQGLSRLQQWCRSVNYPVVAIGGINEQRLPEVLLTGVSGVAVISAITQTSEPIAAGKRWLEAVAYSFRLSQIFKA